MSDSKMLIQNDSEWDLFCRKKSEAEPFILHTTMIYVRKIQYVELQVTAI